MYPVHTKPRIQIFVIATLMALIPTVTQAKEKDDHVHMLTPLQEKVYFSQSAKGSSTLKSLSLMAKANFPITKWNECRDETINGNYYEYRCSKGRNISKILFGYLKSHFISCVKSSAASIGHHKIKDIYIEHKGIFADSRHENKSLHAQGRAIDIKSIRYKRGWRKKVVLNHEEVGEERFYTNLRQCWGRAVAVNNDCPYFENDPYLTGSIGKDDEDHQVHLHLSVPVCVAGKYNTTYFRR